MSVEPIQRQSIVSLIWQIAFTFIGFLSTIYFANAVGASVLGAYFLFIAYLSIISLVIEGGFTTAAIKRISEGEESDAYFSAFVVIRSVFVVVVLTTLIAVRNYFVDLNDAGIFIWLLVALVMSLFYGVVSSGIAGRGKIGISATIGFINNVSRILIQVVAVFLGYGIAGLVGGFVMGVIIGAILQLRFFDLHFVRFGWKHLKNLASFSFWSFLLSGGYLVFMTADSVMIGYFLGNADVGVYRVIFQFVTLAAFTSNAIRGTLLPRVSRWDNIGETKLIEISLSRAFTFSLILAVPLFIGGALLGDKLLYFFYGTDFVSYTTLMILFIVQIVIIFHGYFTTYLIAMDQLKELFKITVVAVVANIVLNATLIPIMGISGAAVATLVTMSLNAVMARRVLMRVINIRVEHSSLINIFKASVAMGLVVGVYRLVVPLENLWVTLAPIVLGGMVYVVLVLKFDRNIYEKIKGTMMHMNVVWPKWL